MGGDIAAATDLDAVAAADGVPVGVGVDDAVSEGALVDDGRSAVSGSDYVQDIGTGSGNSENNNRTGQSKCLMKCSRLTMNNKC